MKTFDDVKRKFANRRQWQDFVTAVQCSVAYPKVIAALREGTRRVQEGFASVQPWLDNVEATGHPAAK